MEKETGISNKEQKISGEVLSEKQDDLSEKEHASPKGINTGSIIVSVNTHKTHKAAKTNDDEDWLSDEEWMSDENSLPQFPTESSAAGKNDIIQDEIKLDANAPTEDFFGYEVFDVEEFEDDKEDIDDVDDVENEADEPSDSSERKRLNLKKIGCISCSSVLALVIILAVTVTAVFYHYYHLMEIDDEDEIYYNDKVSFSDTELSEIPDGDVKIEDGNVYKDKNVFNILLIGTDERTKGFSRNARADSIMILSIDSNTQKIRLVSLERGMLVNIPGRKNDILTHTFRYGGSNLLMETVRTHFKLDVDKYIRVNFAMFQKLVDAVGGVDIDLTEQEAYGLNTYPNHNTWKLKRKVYAGVNHFNGYEALQYSRLRWIDDDFHRIERQRKVIIAIKNNMKDLSVSDLNDISSDCLPYIQTNLSAVECADLLLKIPGTVNNEVVQMTIPKRGTYKTLGQVDFKENTRILREFLYVNTDNN